MTARSSGPGVSTVTVRPAARSALASRSSVIVSRERSCRSSASCGIRGRSATTLAIGASTYTSSRPARATILSEVGERTPPST